MRNRKRNRRFPSCETRVVEAMYASVRPFPDVEQKSGDPVNDRPSRRFRIATLHLSYLSLPIIALVVLPEPLTPFCLLAAVYSACRVLNLEERP